MDRRNPSILLLSHSGEPFCTARVAAALSARGGVPLRLDTDTFPETLALSGELDAHGTRLRFGGEPLDIAAVWLWRLWPASLAQLPEGRMRDAARRESLTTIAGLLDLLHDVPWIDAIDDEANAEHKTRQLRLAARLGLAIPPTLISAEPERVRPFFHAHEGRVIAKLQHSLGYSMAGGQGLPTRMLRSDDLDALEQLRHCPMVFQRYVEKAWELRIAWIDGQAFVGALDGRQCGVDWRYESTAAWQPYALPDAVHARLAALMAALRLTQGAIDMIVDPSGEHVFLEVNPHGEWGMLERDLELPISTAIADALLRRARSHES